MTQDPGVRAPPSCPGDTTNEIKDGLRRHVTKRWNARPVGCEIYKQPDFALNGRASPGAVVVISKEENRLGICSDDGDHATDAPLLEASGKIFVKTRVRSAMSKVVRVRRGDLM